MPCKPEEFHKPWNKAFKANGAEKALGIQYLYVLRHSGASADRLHDRRSQLKVKVRGRWTGDKSFKRYEKGGRSLEVFHKCTTATRKFAETCAKRVYAVLAGSSQPPSVPRDLSA